MVTSRRREREREARRQEIVDAAEEVMRERGFWCTTMDDVAARAELSKGTLYLYFETKDALCAAIAERSIGEVSERIDREVAKAGTGREQLERMLLAYADFMSKKPHLFRMAVSWLIAGIQCEADAPALASYRERLGYVVQRMLEAIERGKRDGSIQSEIDSATLAATLWGGFLGAMLLRQSRDEVARRLPFPLPGAMDRVVDTYVETILRGIEGDRAVAEDAPPKANARKSRSR